MPCRGAVGFVANPASGKDIRRVTARASVFDNQEKTAMVRRCLIGLRAMSDAPIRYLADANRLVESALVELGFDGEAVDVETNGKAVDTTNAAVAMRGAGAVVTLGGDGTNRAFAKGWLDAPLIPLSTGTNNAFPVMREATTAGAAAGLLVSRRIPIEAVAERAKVIHVDIDGEPPDLALIDAVLTHDRFVGARALDDPAKLVGAMLTRADPAGVGMTSVGGFAHPLSERDDAALTLRFDGASPRRVVAALAPGRFESIGLGQTRTAMLGEPMRLTGPGVLAFDGERERVLASGQTATFRALRDGPWVVDVRKVLARAVACGGR
ncbi:MAG: NAD(+)/NADH kinase [Gammaproteobacteria bacterium]|nr:NAD(+)/NADH kinase [Gammaproteobacteria bacterium]